MTTSDGSDAKPALAYEQHIGLNLRRLRVLFEMTQSEVARGMRALHENLDAKAVARIEDGLRRVKYNEAVALAEVLGVSIDQLTTHPAIAAEKATRDAWALFLETLKANESALQDLRRLFATDGGDPELLESLVRAHLPSDADDALTTLRLAYWMNDLTGREASSGEG